MNLQAILLFVLFCYATCEYRCSESDCHECVEDNCQLTCQGIDCETCPNGDCCNGENCNICVRSVCCETRKCNECVVRRRKLCLSETTDPSTCDAVVESICGLVVDKVVFENGMNGITFNKNRHNVTTKIKIINQITSANVVDMPLVLNITNTDDISVDKTKTRKSYGRPRRNCCSIVHPQECHTITGLSNSICFTRRHTECSSLCSNSTHIIIKNDHKGANRCIVISVHPYYYCGYYSTEDCSACYNCVDKDKIQCLNDHSCSDSCRSSVLPRRFYNIPYSIKNNKETTEGSKLPEAQK